ncbi:glycosyltransferase family 2 protein [Microcoleus sp. FACHB-1515]|uniref:glycosyltransferase family 2 protein n=1 Tax=Cyanophyceae TaxID=3028117 RepID=UPI001688F54C|nr:glycosyltransferase family 2 protein [Microcoleus sp. FACHB-1515]MBD2088434.1 glycosyltransferase family 2 protein [Microcoleus sp. FACHB-1515]
MLLINVLLFALAVVLFIPIAVLFGECMAALWPLRHSPASSSSRPRIAVLIPAHNEAIEIRRTLEALQPQLTDADQLLVVADNCTDDTAAIARHCGATVIERQSIDQRGKGYALDFGLSALETNPPDVVVTVDADCWVHDGAIDQIARQAAVAQRPIQALYLMEQPARPSSKDAVSALAFLVKNLVRPAGLAQFGLPCALTGTGMAFPWKTIRGAALASGNIVEDMQLGLDLAIAHAAPQFCPTARVTGRLPQASQAAKTQRTRWEHGHIQTLVKQVPRLIAQAIAQKRFDLLAIALDLSVPPLSLLVMLWAAGFGLAVIGVWFGASRWPAIALGVGGLLILMAIVSAWAKHGRTTISGRTLLAVPFYVLWKIPLYFALLVRPQTQWVRTEREVDSLKP